MSLNDLDAVRGLQETTMENQFDYWSLTSSDGFDQIRTDDYAFIGRFWLDHSSLCNRTTKLLANDDNTAADCLNDLILESSKHLIKSVHDVIIVRIYRLWKDHRGRSWLEGGQFLRPYDLPPSIRTQSPKLWHSNEVVYDESSRLVVPLAAWIGRCMVLCPSAYRIGRPADLISEKHLMNGGLIFGTGPSTETCHTTTTDDDDDDVVDFPLVKVPILNDYTFFVCDRLIQKPTMENPNIEIHFEEICPGYLKVNMKVCLFYFIVKNQIVLYLQI